MISIKIYTKKGEWKFHSPFLVSRIPGKRINVFFNFITFHKLSIYLCFFHVNLINQIKSQK